MDGRRLANEVVMKSERRGLHWGSQKVYLYMSPGRTVLLEARAA